MTRPEYKPEVCCLCSGERDNPRRECAEAFHRIAAFHDTPSEEKFEEVYQAFKRLHDLSGDRP